MKKIIDATYKKYGYKMFDCSIEELHHYIRECYRLKEPVIFEEKFDYINFESVEHATEVIKSAFIPHSHGLLPYVRWRLHDKQTLIKERWFYEYGDQNLYQCAIERAWALGRHLDQRVRQLWYD